MGSIQKIHKKKLVYKTVIDMLNAGEPVAKIAKENGISRPTVYKIKKQYF